MLVHFSKYHGTGNDFIMIDGRQADIPGLTKEQIALLCHRRFGIGADGLIILGQSAKHDFRMRYFNADGGIGSMCGNGGRALVAFARDLGIAGPRYSFEGIDGLHEASLQKDGDIRLRLQDVKGVERLKDGFILNTGSPHYVRRVSRLDEVEMEQEGRSVRHEQRFAPEGVNVNFIESKGKALQVRTFERGVEAETWSCGTGVTASAICASLDQAGEVFTCPIHTKGGKLEVSFRKLQGERFEDVWLKGPALHVYDGTFEL